MAILKEKEIQSLLANLDGWLKQKDEIKKKYEFVDFVQAMGFVSSVALLAERANHHPDIDIRWNKVTLVLSTHSEGGITKKDLALAREIETLSKK